MKTAIRYLARLILILLQGAALGIAWSIISVLEGFVFVIDRAGKLHKKIVENCREVTLNVDFNCLSENGLSDIDFANVVGLELRGCISIDGDVEAAESDPEFYSLYVRKRGGEDEAIHDFRGGDDIVDIVEWCLKFASKKRLSLSLKVRNG